jgi:hypothetical protein
MFREIMAIRTSQMMTSRSLICLLENQNGSKLQKINFITNKNKSKNEVGKSNSQMLLSISFVCVICFTKRFRK